MCWCSIMLAAAASQSVLISWTLGHWSLVRSTQTVVQSFWFCWIQSCGHWAPARMHPQTSFSKVSAMFTYDACCDVGDVQLPLSVSGRKEETRELTPAVIHDSEECRERNETFPFPSHSLINACKKTFHNVSGTFRSDQLADVLIALSWGSEEPLISVHSISMFHEDHRDPVQTDHGR